MCGICGYFGVPDIPLERMNDTIAHRGPDSSGQWEHEGLPLGLAMRRLAIIDLEHGHQPFFNDDGKVVCVFNGEIYNFRELAAELKELGYSFRTRSDVEVLVRGWEQWGEELPNRLRGMFAFAIWDERRGELFLSRDRLGIKPLYYTEGSDGFIFGSEIKAVLAGRRSGPAENRRSTWRHLVCGFLTSWDTMFDGIRQLPPGCSMKVKQGSIVVSRYWDLEATAIIEMDNRQSEEQIRALLSESVREHLISDVTVGLTLSGGLDSTILARLISENSGYSGMRAYTWAWGAPTDETPYAKQAADAFGLNWILETGSPKEALKELERVVYHLEEPLSNVTALTAWGWARRIASDMKVTLVGEGADELFGGYFQYKFFSLPQFAMPMRLRAELFRLGYLQPPLTLLRAMAGNDRQAKETIDTIYHDEFLPKFRQQKGMRAVQGFDIAYELANNQLLRIDKMTMAHGLEARVPYLDHRLVEMAWGLPDTSKIRSGVGKIALRQAFSGKVPDAITNRPKSGPKGSQPLYPLLVQEGIETMIMSRLEGENPELDWIDRGFLQKLLEGKRGVYPVFQSRIRDKVLYSLFMYCLWHDTFLK